MKSPLVVLLNNLPYVFSQGGGSMKRVFLACVAVMFLFGISSVSFASGTGDEMKGKAGTTKEEGKKKSDEATGDMKAKETEMSTGAKSKDTPDKIETKGKEKASKPKTKPADK